MQTKSVEIQDNWQVVPLYTKFWSRQAWRIGCLRRRSNREAIKKRGTTNEFFNTFLKKFEVLVTEQQHIFHIPTGFFGVSLEFFPKSGNFGVPHTKDRQCLHFAKSGWQVTRKSRAMHLMTVD